MAQLLKRHYALAISWADMATFGARSRYNWQTLAKSPGPFCLAADKSTRVGNAEDIL
jgi:hypothetical protein